MIRITIRIYFHPRDWKLALEWNGYVKFIALGAIWINID